MTRVSPRPSGPSLSTSDKLATGRTKDLADAEALLDSPGPAELLG